VNELTSPGARFSVGMADDADVGSNSLQGYELETNKYFVLDVKESQDGSKFAELVLRHNLDRESEPRVQLLLTALDGGDPPRSGTTQLWINVTDANDNPPVFAEDRYRVSLREDAAPGSTLLNVSASDADTGTNARITYGFGEMPAEVHQKFIMDAETGRMSLKESLDFEDARGYSLLVEARDGGGLVSHCKVEVQVLDVNDNPPEITVLSLSNPVPEDAPMGTVVAVLNVKDPDSGENGRVSCELGDEHFSLAVQAGPGGDQRPELVLAKALDREEAAFHELVLRASDGGDPARTGTARIRVTVVDANDNAPVFSQAEYTVRVPEDVPVGSTLVTVTAVDADEGPNGQLKYT
ncbi:PCDGE protein, partial [Catharus fuscescens]|nr:PCDGE protein [Catharus fuscescens]